MPMSDGLRILAIFLLVLGNAVFVAAEYALVTARRTRLEPEAARGNASARRALALMDNPVRFISTVQIGITLVGILAGAYSGASLGEPVAQRLAALGLAADTARSAGFILVISGVTYASLVV